MARINSVESCGRLSGTLTSGSIVHLKLALHPRVRHARAAVLCLDACQVTLPAHFAVVTAAAAAAHS
jgi:hypothetical protein